MTLIFTPSSLTRFYTSGAYNATAPVDLSETPFANVPASLIGWLGTQLLEREQVSQVVLESDPSSSILTAAVSVTAPLGQRTFSLSSESLPTELQTGLLSAWAFIDSIP